MKKKEGLGFKFKIKVLAGYSLLGILAAAAAWFLFIQINRLLHTQDKQKEALAEKAMSMGNILSLLYENESLANNYIQSSIPEHYLQYRSSLDRVYRVLDSLAETASLVPQHKMLQTTDSLLRCRENNIDLIAEKQDAIEAIAGKTERRIAAALPEKLPIIKDSVKAKPLPDPAPPRTMVRSEVIYDTIRTPAPAADDNFWKRIGRYLRNEPQEKSEIVEIRKTKRLITDTLLSISPGRPPAPQISEKATRDTVINVIKKALVHVSARGRKERAAINKEIETLIAEGQNINRQINEQLDLIRNQWFATTVQDLEQRRQTLKETATWVLITAITAFCIIIFFTVLIFTDLNKSQQYRRALEASRNQARDLMKNREKLLLTISHDIKVPLSSILGYLDLLKHPGAKDNAYHLNEYIESMTYSAEHIMELLGNLLEFYRLEAGKTKLKLAPTPLYILFEETLAVFSPICSRKGVALVNAVDIPCSLCVHTDSLHLKQVVMNLLSNAVKYTEHGKIILSAKIENDRLGFSVYDTGCGISEDKQKIIFEEFSRIENKQAPGKEGFGFGLAIVKHLVNLFEGKVSVESNEHKGCTFNVEIPVLPCSATYASQKEIQKKERPASAADPCLRILLLDDDPSQLRLSAEIIKRAGHFTFTAETLPQAWKLMQNHTVDLVFTDIYLGESSGFDLLKRIRGGKFKNLPVVALTANAEFDRQYFLEKGFDHLLAKPFSAADLVEQIDGCLPLIALPPFNARSVFEMTEGDKEAFLTISKIFVASSREALDKLCRALERDDFEAIKQIAHKMLPMFRQFQIEQAVALSLLEVSVATDSYTREVIRSKAKTVIEQVPAVLDAIDNWL